MNQHFLRLRLISFLAVVTGLTMRPSFAFEWKRAGVNADAALERTSPKKTLQGADWELQALGITDEQTLGWLRSMAGRRRVKVAIVGLGGVSQSLLSSFWEQRSIFFGPLNTLEYRDGATDPKTDTPGRLTRLRREEGGFLTSSPVFRSLKEPRVTC